MTDDRIENLLREADRMGPAPALPSADLAAGVRLRVRRRRVRNTAVSIAAGVVILVALGVGQLTTRPGDTNREQVEIALLETQIEQLRARTDATLRLVQEVIERERRQRRLDELEAELASIGDPLEEMQRQADETAYLLVHHAARMHEELSLTDSAIRTYNRVIRLYPQTYWAEVARGKLSEIRQKSAKNKNSEI